MILESLFLGVVHPKITFWCNARPFVRDKDSTPAKKQHPIADVLYLCNTTFEV